MSSQKLLAVVGATGTQGASVISHFLKHYPLQYKLRALTRNPASSSARSLTDKGVEVVQADLDDPPSLQRAFAGANAIFAYTATDVITASPEAIKTFESGQVGSIGEAAYPIEIRQGKNIADAAASVGESLERIVWSSLNAVRRLSGGKYTQAWHEDAKAEIKQYMTNLPQLGGKGKVSSVVMGVFADNAVRAPELFAPVKVCFSFTTPSVCVTSR